MNSGGPRTRARRDELLRQWLQDVDAGNRPDVYTPETQVYRSAVAGLLAEYAAEPAIVIDLSYYNPVWSPERFAELGGDAVVVKATMGYGTDSLLGQHVATVRQSGKALGLYHWLDPTSGVDRQINLFGKAIDKYNPEFLAVDIEQAWKNWSAYWQYIYKKIAWADVPKFTGREIVDFARKFLAALRARYPHLVIMIYTGKWFVDAYAPALGSLMNEYLVWLAQYNTQYAGWANLERVIEIVRHAAERSPVLPIGVTHWDLWQITSAIKIDGLVNGAAVDFNISRMPQGDFLALFGQPPAQPEPDGVARGVVRARNNLRIRAEPNTQSSVLGRFADRTEIRFYDHAGAWLKLADQPGWVFGEYVERIT